MGFSWISESLSWATPEVGLKSQEAAAAGPGSKLPLPAPTQPPNIDQFVIQEQRDEKLLRVSPEFGGQCLAPGTQLGCP